MALGAETRIHDRSTGLDIHSEDSRLVECYIICFRYLILTVELFLWIGYCITESCTLSTDGCLQIDSISTSSSQFWIGDLLTKFGIVFGYGISIEYALIEFSDLRETICLIAITEAIADRSRHAMCLDMLGEYDLVDLIFAV